MHLSDLMVSLSFCRLVKNAFFFELALAESIDPENRFWPAIIGGVGAAIGGIGAAIGGIFNSMG